MHAGVLATAPVELVVPTQKVAADSGTHTKSEITAQPREWADAIVADRGELYTSIDAEDLGSFALREATQSGWPPADAELHSLSAIAYAELPLSEMAYQASSDDPWADAIELALECGTLHVPTHTARRADVWDADAQEETEATWTRDVDLHQAKIVEASLFDPGTEETVRETRRPKINADNDSPEHTRVIKRGDKRRSGRRGHSHKR